MNHVRMALRCGTLALVGIGLAACSTAAGTLPTLKVAGTTTTTTPAPVVTAWLAAQRAFGTAAAHADPWSADLAATTVFPALGQIRGLLIQMYLSGELAKGPVSFGHPRVTPTSATTATVVSCLDDAEVVVSKATGRPVPGPEGVAEVELVNSSMKEINGSWKLWQESVTVGSCPGA